MKPYFFFFLFFSVLVFFHGYSRITGLQGKGEGISLTPQFHFHQLHRYLDISRAIAAESSPLHITSNRTRIGNLRTQVANHLATRPLIPDEFRKVRSYSYTLNFQVMFQVFRWIFILTKKLRKCPKHWEI